MANQLAVVLGASLGLGFSIIKRLLKIGYNVVVVDNSSKLLTEIKESCDSQSYPGKITLVVRVDFLAESSLYNGLNLIINKYKVIDCLINAHMYEHACCFLETESSEMMKLMRTNFHSKIEAIRQLLPCIKKAAKGYILNICSMVGESVAITPALVPYFAASNAALARITESLYKESLTYFPHVTISIAYTTFLKPNFISKPSMKTGNFPTTKRNLLPSLSCLDQAEVERMTDGKVEELFFQICCNNIHINLEEMATIILHKLFYKKQHLILGSDEVWLTNAIIRVFPVLVHRQIFKRWGLHAWRIYATIFEKYVGKNLGILSYPATISLIYTLMRTVIISTTSRL